MARPQLVGATAAAMLPAALSAAMLVSAPFAGTTTAPLADSSPVGTHAPAQSAKPAAGPERPDTGLTFSVSKGSVATFAAGEALLLGVGAGVIVWARRRRFADD
jgi:hypothetical protein